MSSQRGNTSRTRAQKHKNSTVFKNDLHDSTPKVKLINSINVTNVCERCKDILEWKIKYKKYKPLTVARKCTKCEQKTIKHAYHMLCHVCATKAEVCPRCGKEKEIVEPTLPKEDQFKLDKELQQIIKTLPERKRRTFFRFLTSKEKEGANNDAVCKVDFKIELLAKLESLTLQPGLGEDDNDGYSWEQDDDESQSSTSSNTNEGRK